MSKIKILPEILSNKIAAGEVVERPASVVKELVENAIDAGGTRIAVDVEKGGRSLIRVSDNGSGMMHDDALLALERYATSKIFQDKDLFHINTLGFRGEALPSIASVSRFKLTSRVASADSGTEILVAGGKIKNVSEVGAPVGTMVEVRQLFFNTPARRKFLKTIGTEMGHIADMVARIALGLPAVQFRLTHNDKIVKNWAAAARSLDRAVDVLGKDLKNSLYPFEINHSGITVSGWIASPRVTRRTSRAIFIYVNGRFVRDRTIQHALFEGYSQRLVKGQFPVAVVNINLPFDQVDVNVHPTKNEVRFARQRDVHEAVRRAVAQTLYENDRPGWETDRSSLIAGFKRQSQVSDAPLPEFGTRKVEFGMRNAESGKEDPKMQPFDPATRNPQLETRTPQLETRTPQHATPAPLPKIHDPHPEARLPQNRLWENKGFSGMRVIGQFRNTYIVCESDEGLILIDQHAAHERVLYEQYSARAAGSRAAVQKLLVPETVELGYREAAVLERLIPQLKDIGLDIEPFGGNTFVIKEAPVLLADREIKPVLIDIVETVARIGAAPNLDEAADQSRMVMACHAAIRANQALSEAQIKGLLTQLDECQNPSHCPHGRPTWIHWGSRDLEKLFKRIV